MTRDCGTETVASFLKTLKPSTLARFHTESEIYNIFNRTKETDKYFVFLSYNHDHLMINNEINDMDETQMGGSDIVPLEPFVHQVSGHSAFQQFGKDTVCKPLFSRELKFYQEMPSVLKPFIPEFKGVVTVRLKDGCEGNPKLIIRPSRAVYFGDNSTDFSDSDDDLQNEWQCKSNNDQQTAIDSTSTPKPQQYLMLENIISRYNRPSILDLKMGTHTHRDYKTSTEEMQRRKRKWAKTTSSTLGVRIVGMKVYRVDYRGFVYKDKNDGSELTDQGFEETLASFFHNGETFRRELIDCFVKKLERFLEIMENDLCSYRFYNSSLLLVYEGELSESGTPKDCSASCDAPSSPHSSFHNEGEHCMRAHTCLDLMDIRMIDFAHVLHNECTSTDHCTAGPDKGYIFGLKSLLRILRKI